MKANYVSYCSDKYAQIILTIYMMTRDLSRKPSQLKERRSQPIKDVGRFIVFFSMPPGLSVSALLRLAMVIFAGKVYLLTSEFKS